MPHAHEQSNPTVQVTVILQPRLVHPVLEKSRIETITYPADDARFETFHRVVALCLVDFVSCEIVPVEYGYSVVAAREVKKGENVLVEKALIAAVVNKGV